MMGDIVRRADAQLDQSRATLTELLSQAERTSRASEVLRDTIEDELTALGMIKPSTTDMDHEKVEISLIALKALWLIDAPTRKLTRSIVFSFDAKLTQRIRALTIYLGIKRVY